MSLRSVKVRMLEKVLTVDAKDDIRRFAEADLRAVGGAAEGAAWTDPR